MSAERMPTTKPTFKVFVMARVKLFMAKMRLKIEKPKLPSPTKLSTSKIASG